MAFVAIGSRTVGSEFLQRVFVVPNLRVMAQADLAESLEDELFALHESLD